MLRVAGQTLRYSLGLQKDQQKETIGKRSTESPRTQPSPTSCLEAKKRLRQSLFTVAENLDLQAQLLTLFGQAISHDGVLGLFFNIRKF